MVLRVANSLLSRGWHQGPLEHESITLGESLLANQDNQEPLYSRGYGVYNERCGFDAMVYTGHDEFMYIALKESEHNLPEWATYAVHFPPARPTVPSAPLTAPSAQLTTHHHDLLSHHHNLRKIVHNTKETPKLLIRRYLYRLLLNLL